MHSPATWHKKLSEGCFDRSFAAMHSPARINESQIRLRQLLERMEDFFSPTEVAVASAPGRTELGGNHTDHNNGRVLAAAVNLDCLAVFSLPENKNSNIVTIHSENYPHPVKIDISDTSPRSNEKGTSAGLVRGVTDGLRLRGYKISGFNACVSSSIPTGAGLSSSAAYEVLVGRIFSYLFNKRKVSALDIAACARHAENVHFGKPCGFMDQMASSFEGVLGIDFARPEQPKISRIAEGSNHDSGFLGTSYRLCVVDTGGSHADLTPDYTAIRHEMHIAAEFFGKETARGITRSEYMDKIHELRKKTGDRAALRLLHFIEEDARAVKQGEALKRNDLESFLKLVEESGKSSCQMLQNCYSTSAPSEQPIPLALQLTRVMLGENAVSRVHGGGFAGTIQTYVNANDFPQYKMVMEKTFGKGSVIELAIRQPGHEFLNISNKHTSC